MTANEVAALLGWSLAATYEAVRLNRLPHVRVGRSVWFSRPGLERWLYGEPVPTAGAGG